MVIFASFVAGFVIFEALAYRYGAESRPVFDERPERGRHHRSL
jgi:hypothetical protein